MLISLLIAAVIILLDQLSKMFIVNYLEEDITVIKDFFKITYVGNKGIAWGMAAEKWVLIIITIVAVSMFVFMLFKHRNFKENKWVCITLSFLLGGTIGNFIDRVFRADGVVDFLSFKLYYPDITNGFKIATYDFPIFNVADSFLVIGSIMLIFYILFIEPKKEKKLKESNENNV